MNRYLAFLFVVLLGHCPLHSAEPEKRQVLFVCHSVSFIHEAVVPAERALREMGRDSGFELTCFRFTHDPKELATGATRIYGRKTDVGKPLLPQYSQAFQAVTGQSIELKHCGRLDAQTLRRFDAVIFYTKDDPCGSEEERRALVDFVRSGKGFVGVHSATVTHFDWPEYGEMLGGYFDAILLLGQVPLQVDNPNHSATSHFSEPLEMLHEVYQFRSPYQRSRVHPLLSLNSKYSQSVLSQVSEGQHKAAALKAAGDKEAAAKLLRSLPRLKRKDGDFIVSWNKGYGKGRVFYTALGHPPQQWQDPRFVRHMLGGLWWAMGVDTPPGASQ